jgi:hypothetical protein
MLGSQEPRPDMLLSVLLGEYLEWCFKNRATRTYEWYRDFLQPLSDRGGKLRVCDLKQIHVTRWIDGRAAAGEKTDDIGRHEANRDQGDLSGVQLGHQE